MFIYSTKTIVLNTLLYFYRNEDRNALITRLRADNVVYTNSIYKGTVPENTLDCRGFSNDKIITVCADHLPLLLPYINRYKVQKGYKYSVLFRLGDFQAESLQNAIINHASLLLNPTEISLSTSIHTPEMLQEGDKVIFVFNLIRKSCLDVDNDLSIFYSVLAILHTEWNILELRFDQLPGRFKHNGNEPDFYDKTVQGIRNWLIHWLGVTIENLDLEKIANYMAVHKKQEVSITALDMNNRYNTKSSIHSYLKDNKHILPFMDEMKLFVLEEQTLFNQSPELKHKFLAFIERIESTSTYPKITFCWPDKGFDFKVEFTHNYEGKQYTMLRHIGKIKRTEEMNFVTQYINHCQTDCEQLTATQSGSDGKTAPSADSI